MLATLTVLTLLAFITQEPSNTILPSRLPSTGSLAVAQTGTVTRLQRPASIGHFFLALDGKGVGFLKRFDGGGIQAEVINEAAGPTAFVKKHIGQPKYEPIEALIGLDMTKSIFEWIAASWQMNYQRKNGSIIGYDYRMVAQSQRDFFNALITETTIPACDAAASKEPGYLTLKLAPEYTRSTKPSVKGTPSTAKTSQKLWLPSNFKLEIDGLDCSRVAKIDSFTIKQTAVTDEIGDARDRLKEPGKIEFPDLKVTMSENSAATWQTWFDDFVVKGNATEDKERSGRLVLLSPDRQTELLEIKFYNLGIYRLAPEKSEANADAIRRVTAHLYCERMELGYKGAPIALRSSNQTASK